MASLGTASLNEDLTKMLVSAAGKEYSGGSTYDIQFRGPTVKVVEYDEHGREVDSFTYVQEVLEKPDWSEEMRELMILRNRNKMKRIFYYGWLAFVFMSCVLCVVVILFMKGVI